MPVRNAASLARRLSAQAPGLRAEVAERALAAYRCGAERGLVGGSVMAIVDYELPSTARRLWIVDLSAEQVLRRELVAHGKSSGEDRATRFSNESGSLASSLGLYRALDTYDGKHGYSRRLRGLEPGFNDNAERRSVVIHGASYVSEAYAREHGRLGRSWGCPAVDVAVHREVIGSLENGAALFVYYPDAEWLAKSQLLRCSAPAGGGSGAAR